MLMSAVSLSHIPFTEMIQRYTIPDDRWSVILAEVAFVTPYALLVLLCYAKAIAIIYSLPPITTFYAPRRFMGTGLAVGGMKG
jgi:ABC-type glycerol-3-phosphate transport system permease component